MPKQETIKTADTKISAVIYLKHTAELADSLRQVLSVNSVESTVLKYYLEVSYLHWFSIDKRVHNVMIVAP